MNNQQDTGIEISPTIIEQLEQEPTKYWRANMPLKNPAFGTGVQIVFTTERAAWLDRERCMPTGLFVSKGAPFQCTREEVDALARKMGCHTIRVRDETGAVVDQWSVQQMTYGVKALRVVCRLWEFIQIRFFGELCGHMWCSRYRMVDGHYCRRCRKQLDEIQSGFYRFYRGGK